MASSQEISTSSNFVTDLAKNEYIESGMKRAGKAATAAAQDFKDSGPAGKVLRAFGLIIIIIIIFQIIKKIYNIIIYRKSASPWILRGTKDASKRLVIRQDPSKYNSINLRRSENQYGGLEFTYMWWMFIDNWDSDGNDKIIFYKGDKDGKLTFAPKVVLKGNSTTLGVSMNTYDNYNETEEVHNIPINKWIHVVLSVKQRDMDIYINGELAKRKVLKSIPKQNSGDLYVTPNKGFSGFISNFKYFNYFVTFKEIDQYLQLGPSKKPSVRSGDKPPYFSSNWWINN